MTTSYQFGKKWPYGSGTPNLGCLLYRTKAKSGLACREFNLFSMALRNSWACFSTVTAGTISDSTLSLSSDIPVSCLHPGNLAIPFLNER